MHRWRGNQNMGLSGYGMDVIHFSQFESRAKSNIGWGWEVMTSMMKTRPNLILNEPSSWINCNLFVCILYSKLHVSCSLRVTLYQSSTHCSKCEHNHSNQSGSGTSVDSDSPISSGSGSSRRNTPERQIMKISADIHDRSPPPSKWRGRSFGGPWPGG
jgi:hypothetical protein